MSRPGGRKHLHARSHLRRRLANQREIRQPQLVERSPEREARSGTVSKTFQPIQRVAHYVGSFPVPDYQDSNAHEFVREKMSQLIIDEKYSSGKPIKLFILPTGVKVYQVDGETLFMAHALPRIQFTVPLSERSLFSFVAVNPPNKGGEAFCHCFQCHKAELATEISTLVNKSFKLAYAARMSNEKKFDEHRPPAAMPSGQTSTLKPGQASTLQPGQPASTLKPGQTGTLHTGVSPPASRGTLKAPAKPPRKPGEIRYSKSSVEGVRPTVQRRISEGLPSYSPQSSRGSDDGDESIESAQREVQLEKERLLEMKKVIAKRRSDQVTGKVPMGPIPPQQQQKPQDAQKPQQPGPLPPKPNKGPPPALPERHVAPASSSSAAAASASTLSLASVASVAPGMSATLAPPTSAAAASRQALANRASYHGTSKVQGGMMKRRAVKSSQTSGAPKPSLPPREVQDVVARSPSSRSSLRRPISVAAMPSATLEPPRPQPKTRQPPSPEAKPAMRSVSEPSTPAVDNDYDLVEVQDPRSAAPPQLPKTPVVVDADYDLVAFDDPPPAPVALEQPKPKPRKSIRRGKPESSSIKVSYKDDPNVYDDVPEEADEEELAPAPVPFMEPKKPQRVAGFDERVRSNSIDYGEISEPRMSMSISAAPAPADPGVMLDDYEFMAQQPTQAAMSRHSSTSSTYSLPPDLPPDDAVSVDAEAAEIEDRLRELQLEEEALQEAEWFQAGIPREMAMDILRKQPTGGFIVRNSRSSPGSFSLTVKAPSSKLVSFLIRKHPDKSLYTLSDKGDQVFADLPSLLEHYSKHSSVLPCLLNSVISNPESHSSSMVMDDDDYEHFAFTPVEPWPAKR
ncbi:uncharacterized protein LOC135829664 [Sycon ciliatum]|uniref:uncharacterized protein LOC135829664 n=1 Tax=Sycon ciliatum TaxID=27933 RepID=UPI0031F6513B